jgi:hypothetical protein
MLERARLTARRVDHPLDTVTQALDPGAVLPELGESLAQSQRFPLRELLDG